MQIANLGKGIEYIPAVVAERFFMKPCNGGRWIAFKCALQVETVEHDFGLVA